MSVTLLGPAFVYTCDRCAVFRPREDVTFYREETAAMHLVEKHPYKAVEVLRQFPRWLAVALEDSRALDTLPPACVDQPVGWPLDRNQ